MDRRYLTDTASPWPTVRDDDHTGFVNNCYYKVKRL